MSLTAASLLVAVVAIPLVSNIIISTFHYLKKVPRKIANSYLDSGRCEMLLWSSVPPGHLHTCAICRRGPNYEHGPVQEWQEAVSQVFNQAWKIHLRNPTYTIKNESLSLKKRYLRVDSKIVLAYALCTADKDRHEVGSTDFHLEDEYKLERLDQAFSVKLSGRLQRCLTKKECEQIIDGYPPWYRENLKTPWGYNVPHPIKSRDDLSRAGWVFAIRLSDEYPVPIYVPLRNGHWREEYHDNDCNGLHTHYSKAVSRVLRLLLECFAPAFPENDQLESTIKVIETMTRHGTDSGAMLILDREVKDSTIPLSQEQCIFMLKFSNELRPFTLQEIDNLQPVLNTVLMMYLHGVAEIYNYFKNSGHELLIPDGFSNPNAEIYLRN